MPLKFKINVLDALKQAGYNTSRIRQENLLSQSTLQKLRDGGQLSWSNLETICRLLECQPGDILEYIPDDPNKPESDEETDALRAALLNQIKGL